MKDLLEQGVMNGLPAAEIFLEMKTEPASAEQETENIVRNRMAIPSYLDRIPIVDPELRSRCLQLVMSVQGSDTPPSDMLEGLDTAVREMSVILEDRVRKTAGLEQTPLEGVRLMAAAFAGDAPKLRFSSEQSIQDSAHHLYRGYSGFVRNEVMHRLVKTYTVERVLQLLGHVDYLLSLLKQATLQKEAP